MQIFENARQTLADFPDLRSKLTIGSALFGLAHVACISLIYLFATKAGSVFLARDPLVLAATLTSLVFLPLFIARNFRERPKPTKMRIPSIISLVALIGVFFWVNDPLWVKRIITGFALFQIAGLLFILTQLGRLRREKASWNFEALAKAYWITGPTALVTLAVNEAAIFNGNDWVWIASRALMVALVPLSYVVIANIMHLRASRA